MRVVIQRVGWARVRVAAEIVGEIGPGLLVLAGFQPDDQAGDLEWTAGKIVRMRLFPDEAGVMNRSVLETGGGILAISQFTLFASTKKGNRPSYLGAAPPETASRLYETFLEELARQSGKPAAAGKFGAHMEVELLNDGPVTISLDSQARE